MDQSQLLSSAVELGLSLLEKNRTFLPFCKAVSIDGDTFVYTPNSESTLTCEEAADSVLKSVMSDIDSRRLEGIALCSDRLVKRSDLKNCVPAIKVELHFRGTQAVTWYFFYDWDGKKVNVLNYCNETEPAAENLFAE
jgi:hypothetical protein